MPQLIITFTPETGLGKIEVKENKSLTQLTMINIITKTNSILYYYTLLYMQVYIQMNYITFARFTQPLFGVLSYHATNFLELMAINTNLYSAIF